MVAYCTHSFVLGYYFLNEYLDKGSKCVCKEFPCFFKYLHQVLLRLILLNLFPIDGLFGCSHSFLPSQQLHFERFQTCRKVAGTVYWTPIYFLPKITNYHHLATFALSLHTHTYTLFSNIWKLVEAIMTSCLNVSAYIF